MAAYIRMLMRHRGIAAALLLISAGLAAFSARTIQVRFQFADFYTYPSNDAIPLFRQDNEEFGDPAGYVIAMIDADDVFAPHVLDYVQRLTDALTPDPNFSRIRSLTNANVVRANNDEVVSGPLIPNSGQPKSAQELSEIKRYALDSPLLRRRLVSADARTTAVLAQMRIPSTLATIEEQARAIDAMKSKLTETPAPDGVRVRVTGAPSVEVQTTAALMSDQLILTPAVIALLVVMLLLCFRSWLAVLLSLTAVTTATIWTAGIFAMFDRPVDIIASVIPTTILVYGVVDPIFVLTRILQKLDAGLEKNAAITEAYSELALPCALTSVTTAVGFSGFVAATVPSVRYFGLTVAIGVTLTWVTTNTVLPLMLSYLPAPKRRFSSDAVGRVVDHAIESTWTVLKRKTALVLALALICFAAGTAFASQQRISNEYVGGLPRGETLDDVREMEQRLSGVARLTVHLEGPRDVMKDPKVLQAIERVDRTMERDPLVTLSISLADLVAEANQAFLDGDPAERKVPTSRALVGQYLTLVDPVDRSELVSEDYARSHIAMLLTDHGSGPSLRVAADLRRALDASGLAQLGVKSSLTGIVIVGYPELDRIVVELIYGFAISFALIVLLQWIFFRSLTLALLSVIPNLAPVIVCLVVTRCFGIALRIDTALVMCISIGGLFNTTIHYFARVLQRIRAGEHDPDRLLLHAMRAVCPPSLFTAVALSAGFAMFTLSRFNGLRTLGMLSMITLLSGFVSDLVITTVSLRATFAWRRTLTRLIPARITGGDSATTTS